MTGKRFLKVAPLARLRWDRISGRHVLLSPERGLSLNETATAVVELCDGTRTAGDIVGVCQGRYEAGASHATIEVDVRAWLAELLARGLLVEYSEG